MCHITTEWVIFDIFDYHQKHNSVKTVSNTLLVRKCKFSYRSVGNRQCNRRKAMLWYSRLELVVAGDCGYDSDTIDILSLCPSRTNSIDWVFSFFCGITCFNFLVMVEWITFCRQRSRFLGYLGKIKCQW